MNGVDDVSCGWIKLHRKLQDCWIWQEKEPFDKRSAWVDLLLSANHSDKKILFNGELIIVKRGQVLTSIRKLSAKWSWSVNRVYRYLRLLESDNMLIKESDNDKTLLTIVNYEVYQCLEYTDGNTVGNTGEYNAETPVSTPSEHKQECKEDKNAKNEKKQIKEPKRKQPEVYYPNDERLNQAFVDFVEMRKKIKKPLVTDRAVTRAMNRLQRLSNGDNDLAIQILEQSIFHDWQDLYELKDDKNNQSGRKENIDWSKV